MYKKGLLVPGAIWSKPNRVIGIEREIKKCVGGISKIRELFIKTKNVKKRQGKKRIHPCGTPHTQRPDKRTTWRRQNSWQITVKPYMCSSRYTHLPSKPNNRMPWPSVSQKVAQNGMQIVKNIIVVAAVTTGCRHNSSMDMCYLNLNPKSRDDHHFGAMLYLAETFHHVIMTWGQIKRQYLFVISACGIFCFQIVYKTLSSGQYEIRLTYAKYWYTYT